MRAAAVLVGMTLCASAAAGPRAGKVVRIERSPRTLLGEPRQCSVSLGDYAAYCVTTTAPAVGDRITLIDHARVLGIVRITAVQGIPDACGQHTSFTTTGTLERGDLARPTPSASAIGLLGVALDPRNARLITVEQAPTGHGAGTDSIVAVDNNRDGRVDLELVQYTCDDTGNPSANAANLCNDVWSAIPGRGLQRIRQERVKTCY